MRRLLVAGMIAGSLAFGIYDQRICNQAGKQNSYLSPDARFAILDRYTRSWDARSVRGPSHPVSLDALSGAYAVCMEGELHPFGLEKTAAIELRERCGWTRTPAHERRFPPSTGSEYWRKLRAPSHATSLR